MKKLILFILPLTLIGEDNSSYYQDSDSYSDPKNAIAEILSEIHLGDNDTAWAECHEDYSKSATLIREKFLVPYLEYQAEIINHKKAIVKHKNEIAKLEMENELKQKRLELEATSREIRMAESYHSSKTFKMDGRSWYDLPEDLRSSFRQQFIAYYNQR